MGKVSLKKKENAHRTDWLFFPLHCNILYLHVVQSAWQAITLTWKNTAKSRQARQIKYEMSLLAWVQDIYLLKKKIKNHGFNFVIAVFEKLCYYNTPQKSQSECFNNWDMKGQPPNEFLLLLPCHSSCGARRIKIRSAVFSSHSEFIEERKPLITA